ncbi:MAG TPA: NAD(P)H-binding protein, partial [Arenibacter sp.]|nr:NAD(P)H-binding protein [Arenibacter sp.]
MKEKGKTAIILGATGLTGSLLVDKLLRDGRYVKVKLFSRSPMGISDPKIEEFIGDMLHLDTFKKDFYADEVFCCIGTTKAKTPDPELYKKIDLGIPVSAAELCRSNGIDTFLVVSALGADAQSGIAYNRIKGEMETSVIQCGIPKTYILRPSLIVGGRTEKRTGEWIGKQVMKVLNPILLGPLKKYRSINAATIAETMVWLANNNYEGTYIESDAIEKLVLGNG